MARTRRIVTPLFSLRNASGSNATLPMSRHTLRPPRSPGPYSLALVAPSLSRFFFVVL